MNLFNHIVLAALLAALCGCTAARSKPLAKPEAVPVQGDFIHDASGMKFPLHVGEFERRSVRRNDTRGLDVSARYELLSMAVSIAAAVDAYPSPSLDTAGLPAEMVAVARENLTQQSYEIRRREIMSEHAGTILVQEGDTAAPHQGESVSGKMAVFEYEDVFDRQRQVVRSHLHLFCYAGGGWTITYRFTYPRNADASQEIESFLADLKWDLKKPKPAGSLK